MEHKKLTAEEKLAQIEPEGYEFETCGIFFAPPGEEVAVRSVLFRKLPPPVEYEWVTPKEERVPAPGDWVFVNNEMIQVRPGEVWNHKRLCFERRVKK
jgi:hypothetical protein